MPIWYMQNSQHDPDGYAYLVHEDLTPEEYSSFFHVDMLCK